ncbi:helix-turn-helix domain-containing protein [Methylobacterium sp. E-046]|uniref:helix-turn-helix domain-containing protein n=1 Tax=Methylobacterium sp. E-046 TaxID=2836576 RepID=UPI001FBB947A|nr:helix-turn-helix domain-containing protein [Methylobacterium sp. E-046]MCJ2103753.1 helix-turn-helix domain-containing protein [Methylobacterium sp. E-046]
MTYADEIRRQVEAAPRAALPAVTAALWRAYGDGKVTEAEAEALSVLIEARTTSQRGPISGQSSNKPATVTPQASHSIKNGSDRAERPRRPGVGSRPRTDASMERRRRWAASGRLPPAIAARFTLAEQAVLALVAAETARRKDCRLSIENMAAVAGVCRSTVKNAIREARQLGLLTVEERQITGFRNDTNVLRVISPEWQAWIRLARKAGREQLLPSQGQSHHGPTSQERGVKSVTSTPTEVSVLGKTRPSDPMKGCRGAAGDLDQSDHVRILAGGRTGRAMR